MQQALWELPLCFLGKCTTELFYFILSLKSFNKHLAMIRFYKFIYIPPICLSIYLPTHPTFVTDI